MLTDNSCPIDRPRSMLARTSFMLCYCSTNRPARFSGSVRTCRSNSIAFAVPLVLPQGRT